MRSWSTLTFDSATVISPTYFAPSSAIDQAQESAHRETITVVNETASNSHAFIYDSVIGVGLLVLVWVFLSWTYPPINKSPRKQILFRTKIP
jgi:hypothetical protein